MNSRIPASPAPVPSPARSGMSAFPLGPIALLQLACSTLIVMAAFGTWAIVEMPNIFGLLTGGTTNLNGVDDGRDGLITLTLAVIAAALVVTGSVAGGRQRAGATSASLWSIGALICYTLSGAIAGYDWINISRIVAIQGFVEVTAGWGLMLTLAASVVGVGLSVVRLRQVPTRTF